MSESYSTMHVDAPALCMHEYSCVLVNVDGETKKNAEPQHLMWPFIARASILYFNSFFFSYLV